MRSGAAAAVDEWWVEVTASLQGLTSSRWRPDRPHWMFRTRAGRAVTCHLQAGVNGIDVAILYDDTILVSRAFAPDDESLALMWAETQRLEYARELVHRVRCPRCDAAATRARTHGYESLLKLFTRRHYHRCTRCHWRGWIARPTPATSSRGNVA